MGFKGNNKNTYRPKPPKGPIRLTFGIIDDKKSDTKPTIVELPKFEKQEIIGTLNLKNLNVVQNASIPLQKNLVNNGALKIEGQCNLSN